MATKKSTGAEPAGYAEAMREIESILAELDANFVDVDVLGARVERASYLIGWCNERIAAAQMTVDTLVADLDVDEDVDESEMDDESDDDEFDDDDD